MEIVVSTPHGHADLDIVSAPPDTTLADLLRAVTGQAAPATASVDGRATPTTDRIADLDLCIGTTIDTNSVDPYGEDLRNEVVRLVQVTGNGAGHAVPLPPGRHRIGSARRLHADELERAPVETAAFELDVAADGSTSVTAAPSSDEAIGVYTSMLGDSLLTDKRRWTSDRLSVAGRVFELDEPRLDDPPARRTKPAADGTIPFQRRRSEPVGPRRPVVDAARDAQRRSSRLWQRRANDAGAFRLPYGLLADTVSDAIVDLDRHPNIALVGADRFTSALARTLLVEATTLLGPADLHVAVATVSENMAVWNWVKWLPHARRGDPTSAADVLSGHDAITRWASFASGWSTTPANTEPVTLLILDGVDLWSRRESPLSALLAAPPPNLRIVAICSDLGQVPARSTSMIEEVPPEDRGDDPAQRTGALRPALFGSLARHHSRRSDEPDLVIDIRPALVDAPLSAQLARRLAPLDDLEASRRAPMPVHPAAPALRELVDDATGPGLRVAIGARFPDPSSPRARYEPMVIDLTNAGPIGIVCTDKRRTADTVAALALGAASRHSPDHLAILTIGDTRAAWQRDLPHLAGWTTTEHDPARLVHRVSHVVDQHAGLHVLVIIDGALDSPTPTSTSVVDAFFALSESAPTVHVVITVDDHDSISPTLRTRFGMVASIDEHGTGILDEGGSLTGFIAVSRRDDTARTATDRTPLVVKPTTHRRAMTPLERRLLRVEAERATPDPDDLATAGIAQRIASRFVRGVDTNDDITTLDQQSLVPPPLPLELEFDRLMAEFTGDGVPLGLLDRPEWAHTEIFWWQPGAEGTIVAVGAPRAGMSGLVDLVLAGIAARASADDLHVYSIEGLPQRRRALDALPHVGDVVTPGDAVSVELLVEALHGVLLERVANPDATDRPDIVLVAGDVGRFRQALPPEVVDDVFDRLADIAVSGPPLGINLIAIGGRAEDLGPLARLSGERLVATIVDAGDRSLLDAPEPSTVDHRPRRCWSTSSQRLIQLAMPPASLEAAIHELAPEPPARHQPRVFVRRVAS